MNDRADRAEDFEIGPDGQLRRKDNKQPQILGDRFNRNQDGSLRWDGASPTDACSEAEKHMSADLRSQSSRKPVFESDLVRAAMGETVPTSTAATPDRSVPINMLFPDGPRRGDGGVETPRAKARREQRTPVFDAGPNTTSATTSPIHGDAIDARAKAQTDARTPIFDAGPDAPVAGIG